MSHSPYALIAPLLGLVVAGCATPKVTFSEIDTEKWAAVEDEAGAAAIARDAGKGGEIIVLPTTRFLFSPVDTADQPKAETDATSPSHKKAKRQKKQKTTSQPPQKPNAPAASGGGGGGAANADNAPTEIKRFRVGDRTWTVQAVLAHSNSAWTMIPVSDLRSETSVKVAKYPKSDIPMMYSTTFKDKTADRINSLGDLAISVLSLVGSGGIMLMNKQMDGQPGGADLTKEFVIDLTGEEKGAVEIPGNEGWTYQVTYKDVSPNLVTVGAFRKLVQNGQEVGFVPIPGCREVSISLKRGTGQSDYVTVTTTTATPNRLRLEPLQPDGTVTMNDRCGATVTGSAPDLTSSGMTALKALMDKAAAVKAAADKAAADKAAKK